MILRVGIFELIKDGLKKNKKLDDISIEIYDFLDDEGLGIYGNGWADNPNDLVCHLANLENEDQMMLASVAILNGLEDAGLGLDGNGWFDNDDQWDSFS